MKTCAHTQQPTKKIIQWYLFSVLKYDDSQHSTLMTNKLKEIVFIVRKYQTVVVNGTIVIYNTISPNLDCLCSKLKKKRNIKKLFETDHI